MRKTLAAIAATLAVSAFLCAQPVATQRPLAKPLPPGAQIDADGRLNFGIGRDRVGWVELRMPRESVFEEVLNDIRKWLSKTDGLSERLENAFWKGGFVAGVLVVCALQGAAAFMIVVLRQKREQ